MINIEFPTSPSNTLGELNLRLSKDKEIIIGVDFLLLELFLFDFYLYLEVFNLLELLKRKQKREEDKTNLNLSISDKTMKTIENGLKDERVSCFEPNIDKKIISNPKEKKILKDENNTMYTRIFELLENSERKTTFLEECYEGQVKINQRIEERLKKQENISAYLIKENSELRKRRNLEFFVRSYFKIPFYKPVTNVGELIKVMFDDIKGNIKANKDKFYAKAKDLNIENHFFICFDSDLFTSLKNADISKIQNKMASNKDELFLGDVECIREIVYKMMKKFNEKDECNQQGFLKNLYNSIDYSNDLLSDFSNSLHVKIVTPMNELYFCDNIGSYIFPFQDLTDYYYLTQAQYAPLFGVKIEKLDFQKTEGFINSKLSNIPDY